MSCVKSVPWKPVQDIPISVGHMIPASPMAPFSPQHLLQPTFLPYPLHAHLLPLIREPRPPLPLPLPSTTTTKFSSPTPFRPPGNNNEAQQFLSRGGQVIVRMRGLPYDCTAQQVVSVIMPDQKQPLPTFSPARFALFQALLNSSSTILSLASLSLSLCRSFFSLNVSRTLLVWLFFIAILD